MTKKTIAVILTALMALALFASCGIPGTNEASTGTSTDISTDTTANEAAENTKKLSIVTTVFPAYDFARAVAGDQADITMLLKPGAEVHSYAPTADDMLLISKCDVFICIGGESDEDWVEDTIESSGNTGVKLLKMTSFVDGLAEGESIEPEDEHEHDDEPDDIDDIDDADEHEHDEEETDEHVWTSPVNATNIVTAIMDSLCTLDPVNAKLYTANAEAYNRQLLELDAQFRQIAANATTRTLIFADRFPFRYFCAEYGFDYVAAFSGCSASADPSADTITTLISKVKQTKADTVFTIELSTGATADTVCASTGAKKAQLHSCHNVSAEDFQAGVTYIELMKQNVSVLKEVLTNVAA